MVRFVQQALKRQQGVHLILIARKHALQLAQLEVIVQIKLQQNLNVHMDIIQREEPPNVIHALVAHSVMIRVLTRHKHALQVMYVH